MRKGLVVLVSLGLMMGLAAGVRADEEKGAGKEEHALKGSVPAEKGTKPAELVKLAKVSFKAALGAALKKVPGHAIKGELEAEDGFLVYSFEIVGSDGSVTEVEVDGGNGKILDVDKEEANKDEEKKEGDEKDKD